MGLPMARNLARSDHDVAVWNRTASKAEGLGGVDVAATPAGAVKAADVVITMLSDDCAVEAVAFGEDGLMAGMREGAIHASMSTISAAQSRRLAAAHAERSQRYVAALVFGRPDMAEGAALWIVAAGDAAAVNTCRPVFELLGQGVIEAGTKPEHANVMKLAGNFILVSAIEAMAEAYTLVRAHGIDAATFHDTIANRLFRSPIYAGYGGMIEAGRYEPPGFLLRHGLKDMTLALQAGAEATVPLPLASLVHDRLLSGVARGWGDIDLAGLGRVAAADSGNDTHS
jgi:3-hydroxyisobutyrate dehydrogenase-like beta-hydroxyacid dehydrogenase